MSLVPLDRPVAVFDGWSADGRFIRRRAVFHDGEFIHGDIRCITTPVREMRCDGFSRRVCAGEPPANCGWRD